MICVVLAFYEPSQGQQIGSTVSRLLQTILLVHESVICALGKLFQKSRKTDEQTNI
jgi:hypothetical protein